MRDVSVISSIPIAHKWCRRRHHLRPCRVIEIAYLRQSAKADLPAHYTQTRSLLSHVSEPTQGKLERVNVDTTVQEKAIAFPTDARLYHKMHVAMVRKAQQGGVTLRQSCSRVGKMALIWQGRYARA